MWTVLIGDGYSYRSCQVSDGVGSGGLRRHTCKGGSQGRSRLRASPRRIRWGGREAELVLPTRSLLPRPSTPHPSQACAHSHPLPAPLPYTPPASPQRPLQCPGPNGPVPATAARSVKRSPVPLVMLAVTAGEVGGAHAEAAQHAGAAVPAAAQLLGLTCEGVAWVSASAWLLASRVRQTR